MWHGGMWHGMSQKIRSLYNLHIVVDLILLLINKYIQRSGDDSTAEPEKKKRSQKKKNKLRLCHRA